MSTDEKIKIADEVMKRMSEALGVEFTPEQRLFNRGYLVAMMDATEHTRALDGAPDEPVRHVGPLDVPRR